MTIDYRVAEARRAVPSSRASASELLAMTLLVAAILYIFLQYVSLAPSLPPAYIDGELLIEQQVQDATEGSLVNRFFWLAMLAGAVPLIWRYQRRFLVLAGDNLLLLAVIGFSLLSVAWALDPGISFRRFAQFAIIAIFTMAIVAALPSPRHFVKATLIATAIIVALDLLIIPAMPAAAFNYFGELTGVHGDKNLAGSFFLIAGIVWFFASLRFDGFARRLAGFGMLTVIVVLLILTQSKTSMALLPLSVPFAWLLAAGSHRGQFWFALTLAFLIFSVLTATLPLGVVSPLAIVDAIYGDVTFTGRTAIWDFMMAQIEARPWSGTGYGSFWGIGDASPNLRYGSNLLLYVGQAHNGYLDVAAMLGLVGFGLTILLVLVPFWRLFPIARDADADGMAGAAIAIMIALLVAGIIHNVTESSLLRSGHPVWFFTLFAILYLSAIQLRAGRRVGRRAASRQ